MKTFIAYTDGACSGNPGPGGWGAHVTDERGVVSDLWGFEAQTTNNRMEMLALLRVLQAVPSDSSITVYSDSNLLVKGINEWC
ncbi:RNase H family protein, partial [Vibrio alginolyticus]|uniref:RNase H family protein n=1 Tax=Vibrio alginolyticus TaxID=663 RepID=UPI00301E0F74